MLQFWKTGNGVKLIFFNKLLIINYLVQNFEIGYNFRKH